MLFRYKAKNQAGETVEGTIEGINQNVAIATIASQGLIIISLTEGNKALPIWRREFKISFLNKVKAKDVVFLSRQLSVMVSAGLPLVKALEILSKQTGKGFLKEIIIDIADNVRGGMRFSSALAKHPKAFDNFYINMVRAGETSGKLDEVLIYLANEQEKTYDLMSKLKGAMIYPAFVLIAVGGVMVLMMLFVVPGLTGILKESSVELPMPTKILIASSDILQKYFVFVAIGLVGLIIAIRFAFKSKTGRWAWDRFLLKTPVFGDLFEELYMVRFTRSLSTLIVGGIPLTSALKIVADVVSNTYYKDLILQAVIDVGDGRSISTAFLDAPYIPKVLPHLMVIGEETGKLDEVLNKFADFYARDLDNMLTKLVTLLEPMIIIFLAVIVGIMVAAIVLPMYKMAAAI